jgi:hypothetical protein
MSSKRSRARRNPQPIMTASMARSRRPFRVAGSGRLMSASAWRLVSQFPVGVPSGKL